VNCIVASEKVRKMGEMALRVDLSYIKNFLAQGNDIDKKVLFLIYFVSICIIMLLIFFRNVSFLFAEDARQNLRKKRKT
jgi:hypothetical protein